MSWWSTIASVAQVALQVSHTAYRFGSESFLLERGGLFEKVDAIEQQSLIQDMIQASSLAVDVYDYEMMAEKNLSAEISLLHSDPTVISYFQKADKTLWIVCRGTKSPVDVLVDYSWLTTTNVLPGTDVTVPGAVALIAEVVTSQLSSGLIIALFINPALSHQCPLHSKSFRSSLTPMAVFDALGLQDIPSGVPLPLLATYLSNSTLH